MTTHGGKRPGSGRKHGEPKRIRWPIRWSQAEEEMIEEKALKAGLSVTGLIKRAVEQFIG